MAVLIDPPVWPAHDTTWSHLVSTSSYDELHSFASAMRLPRRSFDLDHYDVAEACYAQAVAHGAVPVSGSELAKRLEASGLRVPQVHRDTLRPKRRLAYLREEWRQLGTSLLMSRADDWTVLGEDLLTRWSEPHRSYHNVQHLESVLLSLNHLSTLGERVEPVTLLSAWFHDSVYQGAAGTDERQSAELASQMLSQQSLANDLIDDVHSFVLATAPSHLSGGVPTGLAQLLDADLSIFAESTQRYDEYTRAVREEYSRVTEVDFRRGRSEILTRYLGHPSIFHLPASRLLWEHRARQNLSKELAQLLA